MSEVFISYSRKDLTFVEQLRANLEGEDLGVWVDVEGLYAGEEFWPEVAKAIDAALAVIFVITPDSIASEFCRRELERAIEGQKRIVPLCRREVSGELHPALAKRQWAFFRDSDDPETSLGQLLSAVRADWVRLRQQARLLVRARDWDLKSRDDSFLLRGRDLREAEQWLEKSRGPDDGATDLHREYVYESRRATKRRRLRLTGAVMVGLVSIVMVAWYGLAQRVASLSNLSLDDLNQGQAEAAIDKLEGANALCVRFGSIFGGCRDAALNLGRAYLDAGTYDVALTQFSRTIDDVKGINEDDPAVEDFRATAYQNRAFTRIMLAETHATPTERLEEYSRAEDDLKRAAEISARSPRGAGRPFVITRARIHVGRGEHSRALEELTRASRVSDSPDIDLLLSVVHHCLGDGLKSLTHFKRYIDKLPGRLQDPQWLLNEDYYRRLRQRCSSTDE
jgi:tetratricopeptide (TPR) repeat protein